MQTGELLLLVTVALLLLGGLVSLGIGHRRWNIGTVVAGFLVLLAAATYLYLAARLAERDRAWTRSINDYKTRIAKTQDEPRPLAALRIDHDRWRRGRDRIATWQGRAWRNASFQPPKDDASSGRVDLAAEANAENRPPIDAGAHVFLFDSIPFEEGGAYIGEFVVQSTSYDQATKRHSLTVVSTAPRDAYDADVLSRPHDDVTVFETLPVDRWLAFYRSRNLPDDADSATALPEVVKEDADKVRQLLESSPAVGRLVEQFIETFARHEEDVPEDAWEAAAAEAATAPGTLWAAVEFQKTHSFAPAGAAEAAEDGPRRDFEAGDRAEFDLQTALELRDREGTVTIERVFRRRPLTDALTLLHGSRAGGGAGPDAGIPVDGVTVLLRALRGEIAALDRSNRQLEAARNAAAESTNDERRVAAELEEDLVSWQRDAREAAALADGFEREVGRTTRALEAAERAIVDGGRELTAAMSRLEREIDRVSPPPERRAERP